MRKSVLVLTLLIVIGILGFGFFKSNANHDEFAINRNHTSSPPSLSANAYLNDPRKLPLSEATQANQDNAGFSPECAPYLNEIATLSLLSNDQGSSKLSYQMLPAITSGCEFKDAKLSLAHQKYLKECAPALNEKSALSEIISDACVGQLYFLRASITRNLLKDKPLAEITDMHQLIDLLFAEFSENDGHAPPDFAKLRALSQRMVEMDPNLYVAVKTAISTEVIEGLMKSQDGSLKAQAKEDFWLKAQSDFAKVEAVRPQDPTLIDARDAVATHGFEPDRVIEYSNQMIAKHPDDGRAFYLRAFGEWKKGQKLEAVSDLAHASALDPSTARYASLLTELKKPNANEKSFPGYYQFGVSNHDFDR